MKELNINNIDNTYDFIQEYCDIEYDEFINSLNIPKYVFLYKDEVIPFNIVTINDEEILVYYSDNDECTEKFNDYIKTIEYDLDKLKYIKRADIVLDETFFDSPCVMIDNEIYK